MNTTTPSASLTPQILGVSLDARRSLFETTRAASPSAQRLSALKLLLVQALQGVSPASGRVGVVLDERYGETALQEIADVDWWLARPVEIEGSNPLVFEWGRSIGSHLASWPHSWVVKCEVHFHPDDAVEQRLEQEAQLYALQQAVQVSGHALLLQITLPAAPPTTAPSGAADALVRAVKRLYNLDIRPQWWALSPAGAQSWRALEALLDERDPACHGVLLPMQSAGIGEAALVPARTNARCAGFLASMRLFDAPVSRWLAGESSDSQFIDQAAQEWRRSVQTWQRAGITSEAAV